MVWSPQSQDLSLIEHMGNALLGQLYRWPNGSSNAALINRAYFKFGITLIKQADYMERINIGNSLNIYS